MIDKQREKEINNFLRYLVKISKKEYLDGEKIYDELSFYKISPHKRVDLTAYFNYWCHIFNNDKRISVFVKDDWKFFCQFVSSNSFSNIPKTDPVKIYLSLRPEYLTEGVNQIFNFLSDNNIKHKSKIGRILRADSIVIRVYDIEEAKKLISYINNNNYLIKGHNDISPFCFKSGIVGLAIDNYQSYNLIISNLIYKYLLNKNDLYQLDSVNCHDLCNFVKEYDLKEAFENKDAAFINNMNDLVFVEEIKRLFVKSLSSSNVEEFYQHYYSVIRNRHLVSNQTNNRNMIEDLLHVLQMTGTKYDNNHVYNALYNYLLCGETNRFTRVSLDGTMCREKMIKYDYRFVRQEIIKLAIKDNILIGNDLKLLVDYFYNNYYSSKVIKK